MLPGEFRTQDASRRSSLTEKKKGGVKMDATKKSNHISKSTLSFCEQMVGQMKADAVKNNCSLFAMMSIYLNKKTVVLRLPKDVPGILVKAKDIHDKMVQNAALFVDADPSMADFKLHLDAAFAAEGAMEDPDTDKTNTRNKTVATVILDCGSERDYVQKLVNSDLPNADSIVIDAGMTLKGFTSRQKQVWSVCYTGTSMEIELVGAWKAARCAYEWQYSYTPLVEDSWWTAHLPVTLQSTTKVSGLAVGKVVYLRYRHILKDGPTDWYEVLSILVV